MKARAHSVCALVFASAASLSLFSATSEINVDLKLPGGDFIAGESIRAVVDVANSSPDTISVGYSNSADSLLIEVFRANDMHQLQHIRKSPFVAAFVIKSSEGQKLETFIGDHFSLWEPRRYLVRAVLVHRGLRYEGQLRAFDIVDGVKIGAATQLFATRPGLQREFTLVYWSRNHSEHLFITAKDSGAKLRRWTTRDLGPMLRLENPAISVMPSGEVVVLHRLTQDQFVRSEFWSLPDALEFRFREAVQDPETAGTARVRELYREGGIKAKSNPWWKFW